MKNSSDREATRQQAAQREMPDEMPKAAPVPTAVSGFNITCAQCSSKNVAVSTDTLGEVTIQCATCGQASKP